MPKNSTSNTKIFILTSTFPRWKHDKVTNFVFDFAKQLKQHDWDPIVLAPHYPGSRKKEQMGGMPVRRFQYWFHQKGQNVVYNGGGVPNFKKTPLHLLKLVGYAVAMLVQMIRIARREKVDILNPHWLVPQGFLAVIANFFIGAKVVITIHGSDAFSFNGRILRAAKKWALKRADEVIVNSSATLEATKSLYGRRGHHVIPMGVDTERFYPNEANESSSATFNILFAGRLSEEKGVVYACQAIKTMIDEGYTDAVLRIVGEGPKRREIERYIKKHNLKKHVKLIGWVNPSELPDYYREADVLVGPSVVSSRGSQEAFGLVFAESLATGTPVVATRVGGIRDIVNDGENGFLVPQKDAKTIADKLKLLHDDRKLLDDFQEEARKQIVTHFSWSSVVRRYTEIFDIKEANT